MRQDPSISTNDLRAAEELFHAARTLGRAEREALLDARCGGDFALRRNVERLLEMDDLAAPAFDTPAAAGGVEPVALIPPAPGERVGNYRLMRPIGSGGTGTVWLAAGSDRGADAQVAVKFLHWMGLTGGGAARFQRECEVLSRLRHPAIPRHIAAGVTEGGVPFVAMQLIDGVPIDSYCDSRRLSVRQRVELLCGVCDAVHYSHQQLLVHRDLKPGNILVTKQGRPVVLDFGIAALLENEAPGAHAKITTALRFAMTPSYASPEQIRGEPVTTGTDVYALGVILCELISGNHPVASDASSPHERERRICAGDLQMPSASLGAGPNPDLVCELRSNSRHGLERELRGDLDNIVAKATALDACRRYASVEQMRADLRSYLEGEPIRAGEPGRIYRLRKFALRHRGATAITLALLLAIMVGAVGAGVGLREARRERAEAIRAHEHAERINDFYGQLLSTANPFGLGRNATIGDVLAAAERRLAAGEFAGLAPRVEVSLRATLGRIYSELWMWSDARRHFEQSLPLARTLYGPRELPVADLLTSLGFAQTFLEDPGAIRNLEEAEEILTGCASANVTDIAHARASLGFALARLGTEADLPRAESLMRSAVSSLSSAAHTEDRAYASFGLAVVLQQRRGGPAEIERAFREALAGFRHAGSNTRTPFECANSFAYFLCSEGRHREELEVLRSVVGRAPVGFPDDGQRSVRCLHAWLELDVGDPSRFAPALRRALQVECATRVGSSDAEDSPWHRLGTEFEREGSPAELRAAIDEMIALMRSRRSREAEPLLPMLERASCVLRHMADRGGLADDASCADILVGHVAHMALPFRSYLRPRQQD